MGSYSSCIISRAVEKRINVVVLNVGAESRCSVTLTPEERPTKLAVSAAAADAWFGGVFCARIVAGI